MNAKLAKRLRKKARELTVGEPWEAYQGTKNRKAVSHLGVPVVGTVRLDPKCGKAAYRFLKRGGVA